MVSGHRVYSITVRLPQRRHIKGRKMYERKACDTRLSKRGCLDDEWYGLNPVIFHCGGHIDINGQSDIMDKKTSLPRWCNRLSVAIHNIIIQLGVWWMFPLCLLGAFAFENILWLLGSANPFRTQKPHSDKALLWKTYMFIPKKIFREISRRITLLYSKLQLSVRFLQQMAKENKSKQGLLFIWILAYNWQAKWPVTCRWNTPTKWRDIDLPCYGRIRVGLICLHTPSPLLINQELNMRWVAQSCTRTLQRLAFLKSHWASPDSNLVL